MRDSRGTCAVARLGELLNLSSRRLQQLAKLGVIPKEERGQHALAGAVRGYSRYLQEQASPADESTTLLEARTSTRC